MSVLPCFYKIICIMYKRLFNHWSEHNLRYQKQSGFQQGYSTEHAIMQLIDQINDKFENNCFTLGIFIDLSKAFDTVNHQILISKLKNYGVKRKNLSWFETYLKNCKQYLNYNNDVTNLAQIICGVSQESVLGLLLFLIYVNDLCNASNILSLPNYVPYVPSWLTCCRTFAPYTPSCLTRLCAWRAFAPYDQWICVYCCYIYHHYHYFQFISSCLKK